ILGPDWSKLASLSEEIVAKLRKSPLLADMKSDYQAGAPEIQIVPNRLKANEHGVSVDAIGTTVSAAIAGVVAGRYPKGGHKYDVRVRLEERDLSPLERVRGLKIRNNRGELVPLTSVVDVVEKPSAAQITRKNRSRAVTITGNMAPGKGQKDALDEAIRITKESLPPGYEV